MKSDAPVKWTELSVIYELPITSCHLAAKQLSVANYLSGIKVSVAN